MDRRGFLLAAAGLVSLAGCVNRDGPMGSEPPNTESSTTEPSPDDATETDTPGTETTARSTTDATRTTEPEVPESDALVVTESYPIEGTMVNLGVGGTVQNAGETPLVNCLVLANGDVGDERFTGRVERERLEPGNTWEWEVAFGPAADRKDSDAVENVSITTRAEPSD